jgi:hypothetical protein
MLDPSGQMSRNFLYLTKKVPAHEFQSGNYTLRHLIALTLAFVTCYFQWS